MEQLGDIAIDRRWPFAHGCRCELVWSTRPEPRRSLGDHGYLGMLLRGVSRTWHQPAIPRRDGREEISIEVW